MPDTTNTQGPTTDADTQADTSEGTCDGAITNDDGAQGQTGDGEPDTAANAA